MSTEQAAASTPPSPAPAERIDSPVRLHGKLDEPLSRWLWLVKWLLALPHWIVLAVLWPVFVLTTLAALVVILVTGRYPRGLFDFAVGVLRWSWRVHFYATSALGTDRYPPFTLADVPDYPARLEVDYPPRLSRGLVLVKWLLGLPHYAIVGILAGGGLWFTLGADSRYQWAAGGLIGVLVLVAGVTLAVTGHYPRPLFDLVLGLDRWVVRTAAYAALLTDRYPPFRLDQGGPDPAGPSAQQMPAPGPAGHWSGGRIASVVAGALALLAATGLLTGGAAIIWVDQAGRDDTGFVTTTEVVDTSGAAVTSPAMTAASARIVPLLGAVVGDLRVQAVPLDRGDQLFVGVGPADDVARLVRGVAHVELRDVTGTQSGQTDVAGSAQLAEPDAQPFWTVRSAGAGPQAVTWPVRQGSWALLIANADGGPGVRASVTVGAEAPTLGLVGVELLVGGLVLLVLGCVLVAVPIHRGSRPRTG